MVDNTNFLEQINSEKTEESKPLESFKEEKYEKAKTKINFVPYIFIIVIMVIGFFGYQYLSADKVVVVDFTGMDVSQVESYASLNNLMVLYEEAYDSQVEEEIVLSQNFEAGYVLASQDTLVVEISKGPDPFEVIDLPSFDTTWSKSAVQAWVASNNVDNYAFKYIQEDSVAGDYLIEYILTGATSDDYSRSASLEFIFSEASDSSTVIMESFIGETLASFDTWVTDEGFSYTYSEEYSDIYDEGRIIRQNFIPDSEKSLTDVLEIVVSLGASSEMVEMENLVNLSSADVISWGNENGLSVNVNRSYSSSFTEDKVMDQSVEVGQEVSKGSSISVTVSSGEASSVPNFSAYTYSNHELGVYDYDGQVIVNQQYSEIIAEGKLISQSLSPGSVNDGEQALEVVYSLGSDILIPDFRSENLIDITEWVDTQNDLGADISLNVVEDASLNEDYGVIFTQNYYNKVIGLEEAIDITIATQKIVPDFSAMTLEEAEVFASNASYTVLVEEKYQIFTNYSDFISQSVTAGTSVDKNTIVKVIYSLGMSIVIEDFKGQPLSDLESLLLEYEQIGMDIRLNIEEYYSEDVPASYIISQSIFNSSVGTGESISINVSLGESYIVPDLVGSSKIKSDFLAEENDLNIIYIEEDVALFPGAIIAQSIEPGTKISKSDFIYLTIAE